MKNHILNSENLYNVTHCNILKAPSCIGLWKNWSEKLIINFFGLTYQQVPEINVIDGEDDSRSKRGQMVAVAHGLVGLGVWVHAAAGGVPGVPVLAVVQTAGVVGPHCHTHTLRRATVHHQNQELRMLRYLTVKQKSRGHLLTI